MRSWDIGRWLEAVGKQADAQLELARFGEPAHAMYGLSSAVVALRTVEKGKQSLAERAVLLLDLLPSERRADFVRWLLPSVRPFWVRECMFESNGLNPFRARSPLQAGETKIQAIIDSTRQYVIPLSQGSYS